MAVLAGGVSGTAFADTGCPADANHAVPTAQQWTQVRKLFYRDWHSARQFIIYGRKTDRKAIQRYFYPYLYRRFLAAHSYLHWHGAKVRGGFSWVFTPNTQCLASGSSTVSFDVGINFNFTNSQGKYYRGPETAHTEMRSGRITLYRQLVK